MRTIKDIVMGAISQPVRQSVTIRKLVIYVLKTQNTI